MARHDFDPALVSGDGRTATQGRLFESASEGPWRGNVAGSALGSSITILAYGTDVVGGGPSLHLHPYDETFVVMKGAARFFVGDAVLDASAGDVVFGPAGIPHRFVNIGSGRLETMDIHHSPYWIQTDLE